MPAKSVNFRKLSNFRFFWWFVLVNFGVVATLTGVTQGAALPIAVLVVIFGSAGSIVSLLLSRWLAMKAHSIVRLDDNKNHDFGWLVDDVRDMSEKAGLKIFPHVGVWPGPDANAFATGPGPKTALVAFSTPLLEMMTRDEVKAIAAHEIAHIANRDMLAMTMLQGVINTFVLLAVIPIQFLRIFNFFSKNFSWGVELGSRFSQISYHGDAHVSRESCCQGFLQKEGIQSRCNSSAIGSTGTHEICIGETCRNTCREAKGSRSTSSLCGF